MVGIVKQEKVKYYLNKEKRKGREEKDKDIKE